MKPSHRFARVAGILLLGTLTGCGGGGGGNSGANSTPTPTASLTASSTAVATGGAVTLTWNSSNASSCSASGGWSGTKSTSGSESVGPINTAATYTINCGGATSSVSVVLLPTVTLSANPTLVGSGGSSTLTWSSTNSTTCTASGGWTGTQSTSGTQQVGPITAATTYTLACGTSTHTDTESVTVSVAPVSGQLLISSTTQTDGDTNDTERTAVSNNSFEAAQPLPNPVVLGGFATVANSGPDGPRRSAGDVNDVYRASLTANQVIELTVATPTTGDLDLVLYTSTRTLVNASVGTGAIERITVPAAGEYFVQVFAYSGTSNYVMTIGQTGSNAVESGMTLDAEFVPGEVLAKFVDEPTASSAASFSQKNLIASRHGLGLSVGAPGLFSLLRVDRTTSAAAQKLRPAAEETIQYASDNDRRKLETLYAIKQLVGDPQVRWAEPNYLFSAHAVPNDPRYADQRWHYEQIRGPDAWNIATGNTNVIVAVLDSGVRPHIDLVSRFVNGYDFVSDPVNADDGNGRDNDPLDPGKAPAQGDAYIFHGTHVAGTIGAIGNNGTGVSGVAWNVSIMPLRALGVNGGGDGNDILNAMLYAARLNNISGFIPTQRADVLNMSLGISRQPVCPQAYQDVINQVRAAGVIVVASAGNDSSLTEVVPADAPASCDGVIAVAALDIASERPSYSNAGAGVDVAAPGGGVGGSVFSTHAIRQGSTYTASYYGMNGTSMAAPHVAGVIALMKSVNPTLTPDQIDALLTSGALTDDIGPSGPDALGVGRINAFKAVNAATAGPPPARPGQLSVVPTLINFGDTIATNQVTVSNSGTTAVSVTQVVSSAAWLTSAPNQVDANGLGTYRITVNRTGLATGTYAGTIEFRGSTGTAVRTSVQMQVASMQIVPDAGQHYILLIDPTTFETIQQRIVSARGLAVSYLFPTVAPGTYRVVAGTDANNDGIICDAGEACGEYPLFGQSEPVTVNPSVGGLAILTGYENGIRVNSASVDTQSGDEGQPRSYRRMR